MTDTEQQRTTIDAPGPADMSAYITDILEQPRSLRALLDQDPRRAIATLAERLPRYDRIVLTGMGASLAAVLPAWLALVRHGLPAWRIETAQLIHDAPQLVTPSTLVLAASQSGRSAELVTLTELVSEHDATMLALTNDPASALGQAADAVIDIAAGPEHAVSTRSYCNTMAAAELSAEALIGGEGAETELRETADGIEAYLGDWRGHVDELTGLIGLPSRLYVLARGASSAAAECGALIIKEAAKWPAEALTASQFRHGPLELADRRLTAILLAGDEAHERERNQRLLTDLRRYDATAVWVDTSPSVELSPTLQLASARGAGLPVAQIVALQLLSVSIAEQTGIQPGTFRHLDKVTTIE